MSRKSRANKAQQSVEVTETPETVTETNGHTPEKAAETALPEQEPVKTPETPVPTVIEAPAGTNAPRQGPVKYNARASESELDDLRCKKSSKVSEVNALLSETPQTIKQLSDATGCKTVSSHMGWALKQGYVLRVGAGSYVLAPHLVEARKKAQAS